MRTSRRRAVSGLLSLGIITTAAAPARARDAIDKFVTGVVVVIGAVAITDVVFTTYDVVVAGKGELPRPGWAIAETVFVAPQMILCNIGYSLVQDNDNDDASQALMPAPTLLSSILTTHGLWSTATTDVKPSVLMWGSVAVGSDIALTTGALASAQGGHFSGRALGLLGMALTAPQIAAAGYLGATTTSNRAGWIGLTAWSGALFTHGLVSVIRGRDAAPPVVSPEPSTAPSSRPPLLVPESLRIGPTIVTDGVASAPGIGISGLLF